MRELAYNLYSQLADILVQSISFYATVSFPLLLAGIVGNKIADLECAKQLHRLESYYDYSVALVSKILTVPSLKLYLYLSRQAQGR